MTFQKAGDLDLWRFTDSPEDAARFVQINDLFVRRACQIEVDDTADTAGVAVDVASYVASNPTSNFYNKGAIELIEAVSPSDGDYAVVLTLEAGRQLGDRLLINQTAFKATFSIAGSSAPGVEVSAKAGALPGLKWVTITEDDAFEVKFDGAGFPKASETDYLTGAVDKQLSPDVVASTAAWVTLTDAANIAMDLATFLNATVTLAGNRTLDNPTNGVPGFAYKLEVVQDATGSRTLAWASNYTFPGGTAPVLSTVAGAKDTFSIVCRSGTEFWVYPGLGMA